MKIIELLTFFNEVELLKVHIEEHWDYVDKFVVSEAAHTYAKNPKPYYFLENAEVFKPYMDKVQYEPFDMSDSLFWSDCRANQNIQQYWPLLRHPEFMRDYDYCVHNDLDEIVDRRHWPRLMEHLKARPKQVRLYLRHFRNYLDWEFPAFPYEVFRFSRLDGDARFLCPPTKRDYLTLFNEEPYGYHFTFMGGTDRVKYKLANFMHYRNVTKEVLEGLQPNEYSMYYRDDKYGAPNVWVDGVKDEMPKSIQDNWEFFKTWVSPEYPIEPDKDQPSKRFQR